MLLGEYSHTIDSKGRIIIPSKFREILGKNFIVTKGLDSCLFAYTHDEWKLLEEKVSKLPITDEGIRRFIRFFFGGASDCETDNQGRISLPQNLRTYASLNKEIVSLGVFNRVEIWSKEKWTSYNEQSNFIDKELAEKMSELGI